MSNDNSGKKIILSGIQPSGSPTLGSYLGALCNWASLSKDFDCYYMIADMHAITTRQDPVEMRKTVYQQLAILIACGIDPNENVLFIQSHVPAHAQLAWVLNCYTMYGELSRMTQFKDKSSKNAENINAGLFTYPALQAADILLYSADLVPVGGDQKQHVELTRDIATRFNSIYGDVFKLPEPYIPSVGTRIMDLQTPENKMSKSEMHSSGCVLVLDSSDDILRAFKRAVTDSDTIVRYDPERKPGVSNLISIYSASTDKSYKEIEAEFEGKGYGDFKQTVGEAVVDLLSPIRNETLRLLSDKSHLDSIFRAGAEKASHAASRTLSKVYKKIGFVV